MINTLNVCKRTWILISGKTVAGKSVDLDITVGGGSMIVRSILNCHHRPHSVHQNGYIGKLTFSDYSGLRTSSRLSFTPLYLIHKRSFRTSATLLKTIKCNHILILRDLLKVYLSPSMYTKFKNDTRTQQLLSQECHISLNDLILNHYLCLEVYFWFSKSMLIHYSKKVPLDNKEQQAEWEDLPTRRAIENGYIGSIDYDLEKVIAHRILRDWEQFDYRGYTKEYSNLSIYELEKFYTFMPILLNLNSFIHKYDSMLEYHSIDTAYDHLLKRQRYHTFKILNILIYSSYFVLWLYILILRLPSFHITHMEWMFIENFQDINNPFTDMIENDDNTKK